MTVDIKIDDWIQIETTTRCTLKCPACSRTKFAERFNRPVPTRDIDPDILWNFFNCDVGNKITGFLLCGDWGDSIYYPRLFELIDKFRHNKIFHIVTNGSYQKPKFWKELLARLDHRDTLEFSIDGLEDTNHLYRRNSDWNSTMTALQIVAQSPVQLKWATNIFSFNYPHLDDIKKLAESFNAEFICKLTSRFGDETLRPPEHLVNRESEFSQTLNESLIEIDPKCKSTSRNSISSYHMYMPCGWMCAPFVFYNSPIWKNKDLWSIKNTNIDELLERVLTPWVKEIQTNPAGVQTLCKMKCKKGQPDRIYYE